MFIYLMLLFSNYLANQTLKIGNESETQSSDISICDRFKIKRMYILTINTQLSMKFVETRLVTRHTTIPAAVNATQRVNA